MPGGVILLTTCDPTDIESASAAGHLDHMIRCHCLRRLEQVLHELRRVQHRNAPTDARRSQDTCRNPGASRQREGLEFARKAVGLNHGHAHGAVGSSTLHAMPVVRSDPWYDRGIANSHSETETARSGTGERPETVSAASGLKVRTRSRSPPIVAEFLTGAA